MSKNYIFMGWDTGRELSQTMITIQPLGLIPFTTAMLRELEAIKADVMMLYGIEVLVLPPRPQTHFTAQMWPRCNADIERTKKSWTYSKVHPLDAWSKTHPPEVRGV